MDRYEAQYQYWNQFGVPAYEENNVPDRIYLTYPYITYQEAVGGWGDILSVTAKIYDRNPSKANVDALTDLIEHHIRTADPVSYDRGKYRVFIGETAFAQPIGDPDDDLIKGKVLNVNIEFMQIQI